MACLQSARRLLKKHYAHDSRQSLVIKQANAIPFEFHLAPHSFVPHHALVIATSFHREPEEKNATLIL